MIFFDVAVRRTFRNCFDPVVPADPVDLVGFADLVGLGDPVDPADVVHPGDQVGLTDLGDLGLLPSPDTTVRLWRKERGWG